MIGWTEIHEELYLGYLTAVKKLPRRLELIFSKNHSLNLIKKNRTDQSGFVHVL